MYLAQHRIRNTMINSFSNFKSDLPNFVATFVLFEKLSNLLNKHLTHAKTQMELKIPLIPEIEIFSRKCIDEI